MINKTSDSNKELLLNGPLWEYEFIEADLYGSMREDLVRLGRDGWELVTVLQKTEIRSMTGDVMVNTLIFKRRIG